MQNKHQAIRPTQTFISSEDNVKSKGAALTFNRSAHKARGRRRSFGAPSAAQHPKDATA